MVQILESCNVISYSLRSTVLKHKGHAIPIIGKKISVFFVMET